MKTASFSLALLMGFGLTATARAEAPTTPPCGTGARILCGAPVLPKHPKAKPVKVRKSGPIARTVTVTRG